MLKKLTSADPETKSDDLVARNVDELRKIFPDAFIEEKIDFELLKQLLGGAVDEREEKFGLNWHGKRRVRQLALTPSAGTLLPCPEEQESMDWQTTLNVVAEGDNLEVLKLLQKSYAGRIKLIYIDPPYNRDGDVIYPDSFTDSISNYLELTGQIDQEGRKLTSSVEASGRFHTDWLNMMYPRLKVARLLLDQAGLIFVSCDSGEFDNLTRVMDELFGEENLVAQLVWKKTYGGGAKTKYVVNLHDYILCYARSKEALGRLELPPDPAVRKYYKFKDSKFEQRGPYRLQPLATTSNDERSNLRYAIEFEGQEIWPEKQWQWERDRTLEALANDELVIAHNKGEWSVNYKQYLLDEDGVERGAKPFSILDGPYTQTGSAEVESLFGDAKVFPFPKPSGLIRTLLRYAHPLSDFTVLDFFAGSGTTGEAVMAENASDGGTRRFILVQLPEPLDPEKKDQQTPAKFCDDIGKPRNVAELTKERLRRASGESVPKRTQVSKTEGFGCLSLPRATFEHGSPTVTRFRSLYSRQSITSRRVERTTTSFTSSC